MKKILLLSVALLQLLTLSAQSLKLEAPNLVATDEQFTVTFIFEGENKPSGFEWNPGTDFQLVWGPQQGSSTSISIINGKQTKSVQFTYTYILRPKSKGTFTLSPARASVKGKELVSSPHTIEVVDGDVQEPAASSDNSQYSSRSSSEISDKDIFLRMNLSRSKTVVGEPVTLVIKLYQRVNITGFDDAKFPAFNGFWSQDITPSGDIQFVRENLDGKIYNSAVIKKYILIPQQAGVLEIEPSELVCRIYVKVASAGNSIFDGFFDDYTTVRKRVSTPALRMNVSELPAGAPSSFGGGVGNFTMSAKVSKDSLSTHEAASLIVTVSGTGNVSLLEAPKVKFPLDMEAYDTKTVEKTDKSTGGISGSKVYEYPFIPRSAGDFVIDPVKYSYYDVKAGKYVTLQSEPISIHVAKGNEAENTSGTVVVPSGVNKKGVANLNEDIRFIESGKASLSPKGDFFVGSGLFWFILAAMAAASVSIWFAFRKIASRKADVAGAKTRKATKMARKRLKKAGEYLSNNLYTAYYEELHKALLGFVSDKLSIPVSDLSKENIAEKLVSAGVDKSLTDEFVSILDACEYARYSPDSGKQAMQEHYDQSVSVISMIDSRIRKIPSKSSAVIIIAMLLSISLSAGAQQKDYADSLWNRASECYSAGLWEEARTAYMDIDKAGFQSASLYFNIGNTWFKSGEYGKAILYYERALKLDPSYSDAEYNLSIAENYIQDDIEEVPQFILKTWVSDLCYMHDSDTWAVHFLVLLGITFIFALLFLLGTSPSLKKTGFFAGVVTLLLAAFSLSFSLYQKNGYYDADKAVIMRAVTSVKSSPTSESSTDLFILHEGTRVKILDNVGDWCNIELSDGRQGWMRKSDLEII